MINELILAGVSFFHPHVSDSLGVETINGKVFVVHRVDEKETLYAIARRYNASVDAIVSSNPGLTSSLEVGQIIKVPYTIRTQARKESTAGTHRVEAKETMYSISRQYGVAVDDIRKWNNLTDNNLSIGQELIIRKPSVTTARQTEVRKPVETTTTTAVPSNGMHTVVTGETMYSIARQYGITVPQIKTWNSLGSTDLQVGQSIYVSAPKADVATVTPQRTQPAQTPTQTSPAETRPTQNQQQPRVDQNQPKTTESAQPKTDQSASSVQKPQTIRISESLKNSDEISEAGVAELIDGTEGNRKYLALHRTAPVGTILKVRNEMNNREVFVRVMGKLPDTAINDKVIIKISRSAYDRLGAIDPRFRVELTYYK
jgi:LysM repeat protein